MLLLCSALGHASEIRLGAALGGPATPTSDVALIYDADGSTAATLKFEFGFDPSQVVPVSITPGPALNGQEVDFAIVGAGNIARVIVSPAPQSPTMPSGILAYIRFDLPASQVSGHQVLSLSQVEALDGQSGEVTGVQTLAGYIADYSDTTTDTDGDGINDAYEAGNGLHPLDGTDAALDADSDGVTNLAEYQIGTDINSIDTDGDGLDDLTEEQNAVLDPLNNADAGQDYDGDGLPNDIELALGTPLDIPAGTPLAGGTTLSGTITTDTVLVPDATYPVSADLEVADGVTLTIAPGTVVEFASSARLLVNGQLEVRGLDANNASLTSDGSTSPGAWDGVEVGGTGNVLVDHATLQWADKALFFNGGGGEVHHSTLRDNYYGIYLQGATSPQITDGNLITANLNAGIYIYGAYQGANDPHPVVTGNSLYGNTSYDYQVDGSYQDAVNDVLDASNNWWGTADASAILANIKDNLDSNSLPVVEFLPYLDADGGQPTTGNVLKGTLAADQTLSEDSYIVLYDLIVPDGVTLTVDAGTELRFTKANYGSDKRNLQVDGTLQVQGTAAEPVTFTLDYAYPSAGSWDGIIVNDGASVVIDYATIQWADKGILFDGGGGEVHNSTLRDNYYGIYLQGASSPQITDGNLITANNTAGVYIYGAYQGANDPHPVVTGNRLYGNTGYDYQVDGGYLDGVNDTLDASNNWWGTADASTILGQIRDNLDSNSLPVVEFLPYLDADGGQPTSGNILKGTLVADQTVAAGSYIVLYDLIVPNGVTLTVQAGAELRFYEANYGADKRNLQVDGTLLVQGTQADPAVFTTDSAYPSVGKWDGIDIHAGANAVIDYATVQWAEEGLFFDDGAGEVHHSTIRDNNYGIYLQGASSPQITDGNLITANVNAGVYMYGTYQGANDPHPVVTGNSLYGNTSYDYWVEGGYVDAANDTLNASNNWWGTTDEPTIESRIRDYNDSTALAVVQYAPYLDGENGNPIGGGSNTAPVANDDSYTVDEDSVDNALAVLTNDTDAESDPLTVTAVGTPSAGGTVTIDAATTGLLYSPAADYAGSETFTYTVSDGTATATGTVTVTVTNINDAPVAGDDAFTVSEDSLDNALDVLANDTDADSDPLTITAVGTPDAGGTATINATSDGLEYTPTTDFFGSESFTYTVSDGTASTTATVAVTVTGVNDAPIVVDDSAETAPITAVTIAVLGNDSDPEGDILAVSAVTQGTKGSVVINGDDTVTYTPYSGESGEDTFTYTADDGNGGSAVGSVTVDIIANVDPAADAGISESVGVGDVVPLDGSGSADPDADYGLDYEWQISGRPAGSTSALISQTDVNPYFTADAAGEFSIDLRVTDGFGATSPWDTVQISTTNVAPVADAGPDQVATSVGTVVNLDGSSSYDADGDTVSYTWTLTSTPEGSQTTISGASSANASLTPDLVGTYTAQLVVSDGTSSSEADTVTVNFGNVAPVADAGDTRYIILGNTVSLDASGSTDANNDPLAYQWHVVSAPAGSTAAVADPTLSSASFLPDVVGTYVIGLVVDDGLESSMPDNLTLYAYTGINRTHLTDVIVNTINAQGDAVFRNSGLKKALANRALLVLRLTDESSLEEALNLLSNNLRPRVNGCTDTGSPEGDDWITDCANQNAVYNAITDSINLLEIEVNGG